MRSIDDVENIRYEFSRYFEFRDVLHVGNRRGDGTTFAGIRLLSAFDLYLPPRQKKHNTRESEIRGVLSI